MPHGDSAMIAKYRVQSSKGAIPADVVSAGRRFIALWRIALCGAGRARGSELATRIRHLPPRRT
jgi:hypothetical protein